MSKKKLILISIAVLLVGAVSGAAGGYTVGKNTAKTTISQKSTGNSINSQEKNLYNGDELTLVDMYASLQASSGDDFDRKLLIYLLSIYNNETGMLRQAETKAQHAELKDLAKTLMGKNEQVIPLMEKWQKQWGYSHH
jgi:uncharacterized protein (DUF305 family)